MIAELMGSHFIHTELLRLATPCRTVQEITCTKGLFLQGIIYHPTRGHLSGVTLQSVSCQHSLRLRNLDEQYSKTVDYLPCALNLQ